MVASQKAQAMIVYLEDDTMTGADVLPGLEIKLAEISKQ